MPAYPVLKKIGLALAAVALALGVFEVYLRWFPPQSFARLESLHPILRTDDRLGCVLIPNVRKAVLSEDGVHEFLVETNSHGLREAAAVGAEGRRNILGLGDSYFFGDGVDTPDRMSDLLQTRLEGEWPARYRMINAGVPGYSTNQEIIYYLDKGEAAFDPEMVVLFFYLNDFALYFDVNQSQFQQYEGIPLADPAALTWVKPQQAVAWQTWKFLQFSKKAMWDQPNPLIYPFKAIQKTAVLPMEARQVNRDWNGDRYIRTDRLKYMLGILKRKIHANRTKLVFVYLPSSQEAEEGPVRSDYLRAYDYPASAWDWDLPSRTVEAAVRELGIPWVSALPAFKDHWRSAHRSLFINQVGHYTPEGHRLVAETVWPELKKEIESAGSARSEAGDVLAGLHQMDGARIRALDREINRTFVTWTNGITTREIIRAAGPDPFRKTFASPAADPIRFVRFYFPPDHNVFGIELYGGDRLIGQTQVRSAGIAPPGSGWGKVNIPVPPAGADTLLLVIRPAPGSWPAMISAPHGVHPRSAKRPPVILISLSALPAGQLPVYGHARNSAPALTAFSAQAAVFDDVTAPSPWTLPSHVSMLTGVDPFTHQVIDDKSVFPQGLHNLASILGDAGYVTVSVTSEPYVSHRYIPFFHTYIENPAGDFEAEQERLLKWVMEHQDEAFFLFYQTAARYESGRLQADGAIGLLFDVLKQRGLYDESLILVTSDRGGDPGDFSQSVLRVPLMIKRPGRTRPLRISQPVGLVDLLPTVLEEAELPLPTVIDGRSLLPAWPGRGRAAGLDSFRLFLMGARPPDRETKAWGALRLGNYKLISLVDSPEKISAPNVYEVYNLSADLGETRNLAADLAKSRSGIPTDLWTSFWLTVKFKTSVFKPYTRQ